MLVMKVVRRPPYKSCCWDRAESCFGYGTSYTWSRDEDFEQRGVDLACAWSEEVDQFRGQVDINFGQLVDLV